MKTKRPTSPRRKREFTINGKRCTKKDEHEINLLAELQKKHGYMFMRKPKVNMVMNLKTMVLIEHLEYKVVVPKWCAFATAFPLPEKKRRRA